MEQHDETYNDGISFKCIFYATLFSMPLYWLMYRAVLGFINIYHHFAG